MDAEKDIREVKITDPTLRSKECMGIESRVKS